MTAPKKRINWTISQKKNILKTVQIPGHSQKLLVVWKPDALHPDATVAIEALTCFYLSAFEWNSSHTPCGRPLTMEDLINCLGKEQNGDHYRHQQPHH